MVCVCVCVCVFFFCLPFMIHFPWGRTGSIFAPCSWDFGSSVLICKRGTMECLVCNASIELEPWACCRDQAALSGFLTLLCDSPTMISEPQTTDPWHAPRFHGSSEVSRTRCHCGHRLPKSQAWTKAPHPVRLDPPTQVSRQHCKLKPSICFLPVFFFFFLCVWTSPCPASLNPHCQKYFPDLDSKKFYFWNLVTGQACAIFSKCLSPHWEITLVSGCWYLLTLCRVEVLIKESVFFSAPGLSFQGEWLPTKHHTWPPSTSAPLRSFPSAGFKGEAPAWWVLEGGWCLFLPSL